MDLIKKVAEAEQAAQQRKADAAANAKKLVADAEREGRERLSAAHAEAEAEAKRLMAAAEADAAAHETEIMLETKKACDALRQSVSEKLPAAAQLIVGRVVNA